MSYLVHYFRIFEYLEHRVDYTEESNEDRVILDACNNKYLELIKNQIINTENNNETN